MEASRNRASLRLRQAEHLVCAEASDLQRLNRELEIVSRAGRRREMEDTVELTAHVHVFRHVVLNELEAVAEEMGQVFGGPRDVVVHGHDGMALLPEAIAQMRSQEACGPGDQDSHSTCPLPIE